jgi:hypothetical protein
MTTPENTTENPADPKPAHEGDIQMDSVVVHMKYESSKKNYL